MTDSNRRPPRCKRDALPIELIASCLSKTGSSSFLRGERFWAQVDLNYRLFAYQANTLTN